MRGQALAVAGAVMAMALTAVTPAAAQNYGRNDGRYGSYHDEHVDRQQQCSTRRNHNSGGGAVIGSVAGAVIGSQVARRGHRTDGSVLGAVVGGIAGAMIGRDSTRCDDRVEGAYDPYYGQASDHYGPPPSDYGYDPRYEDDKYGDEDLYGGRDDGYSRGGYYEDNCRWGDIVTRDRYGNRRRERVWMCQDRDGVWHPERRY